MKREESCSNGRRGEGTTAIQYVWGLTSKNFSERNCNNCMFDFVVNLTSTFSFFFFFFFCDGGVGEVGLGNVGL